MRDSRRRRRARSVDKRQLTATRNPALFHGRWQRSPTAELAEGAADGRPHSELAVAEAVSRDLQPVALVCSQIDVRSFAKGKGFSEIETTTDVIFLRLASIYLFHNSLPIHGHRGYSG